MQRICILDISVVACPTLTVVIHIGVGTLVRTALHSHDVNGLGITEVALECTLDLKEITTYQIRHMWVSYRPLQYIITGECFVLVFFFCH